MPATAADDWLEIGNAFSVSLRLVLYGTSIL